MRYFDVHACSRVRARSGISWYIFIVGISGFMWEQIRPPGGVLFPFGL